MKKDFKIIFWFLKPYKYQVLFIFFSLFIFSFLETISIGAFYPFINSIIEKSTVNNLNEGYALNLINSVVDIIPVDDRISASCILLFSLFVLTNLFGFVIEGITSWYRYRLFADFLNKVFEKLIHNKYSYFLEKKQGDLLYVGMNASQAVGEMLLYFPKVGIELFRIIVISALLFSVSVNITGIAFCIICLFGVLIQYLSVKVVFPVAVKLQDSQSELTSVFSESIAGIRQIKTFNSYKYSYDSFADQTNKVRNYSTKNIIFSSIPQKIAQVIGVLFIVASILYVKYSDPANFNSFLSILGIYVVALQKLMPSISNIGQYWMGLKSLSPRLQITYETLIDEEYENKDGGKHFKGLKNEMCLTDVFFSFPSKYNVLNNINLNISKGSTVAFVGESGAGKSTLVDLLIRLNKPTKGKITIDQVDYLDFKLSDWLKHIGMVSQDTFIFNASISKNIKMGKPDATKDEVLKAAKIADAHKFIMDMREGYDTIVGDRGLKLSGGQRQRIAIARAIIKNPEILILDEATSALDNISEQVVQEAIKNAGRNRTNLIIAHRLSTIEHADKIVVFSKGRIVEQGRHEDLIENHGAYYDLYQKQGRKG